MRRLALATLIVGIFTASTSAAEYYRLLSEAGYYPPYTIYYCSKHGENHMNMCLDPLGNGYYAGNVSYPLPTPCDQLETFKFAARDKEDARKPKPEKLSSGSPFPGTTKRHASNYKHFIPEGTGTTIMTPSQWRPDEMLPDQDFIAFEHDERRIFAKVFQIKGRKTDDFPVNFCVAVEVKPYAKPLGDVSKIEETGLPHDGEHYVLSATYSVTVKGQKTTTPMIILLCNDSP